MHHVIVVCLEGGLLGAAVYVINVNIPVVASDHHRTVTGHEAGAREEPLVVRRTHRLHGTEARVHEPPVHRLRLMADGTATAAQGEVVRRCDAWLRVRTLVRPETVKNCHQFMSMDGRWMYLHEEVEGWARGHRVFAEGVLVGEILGDYRVQSDGSGLFAAHSDIVKGGHPRNVSRFATDLFL